MLNLNEIKKEYYNKISADIRKLTFELKQATRTQNIQKMYEAETERDESGDEKDSVVESGDEKDSVVESGDEKDSVVESGDEKDSVVDMIQQRLNKLISIKNEIDNGVIVDEIYKIKEDKESKIKSKIEMSNASKQKKLDNKLNDKKVLDHFYKDQKDIRYTDNKLKYFIKNKTKKFREIIDTIPEHIKKNINGMPNNKGHIWRGVYIHGMLQSAGDNTTYKERYKGEQYSHLYTADSYKMCKIAHNGRRNKQVVVKDMKRTNPLLEKRCDLGMYMKPT